MFDANNKVAACFYTSSTLPVWRLSRYPTLCHTAIHYIGTLEFRYACYCSKVTFIQCPQVKERYWGQRDRERERNGGEIRRDRLKE